MPDILPENCSKSKPDDESRQPGTGSKCLDIVREINVDPLLRVHENLWYYDRSKNQVLIMRMTRRNLVPVILRLYYKIEITRFVPAQNLLDGRKEMVPEPITSPSDIRNSHS